MNADETTVEQHDDYEAPAVLEVTPITALLGPIGSDPQTSSQ